MVIVDRSKSLIVEPRTSISEEALDHIGMSSYSNIPQISKSYEAIFEILWNFAKMYNLIDKSYARLKTHEKMQREFIDIVAHELRTPLQSILGLTEIVKLRSNERDNKKLLETVLDNGSKLHRFIENILTATKLEGFVSNMPREVFNLNTLLNNIIDNYRKRFENLDKSSVPHKKEILFDCKGFDFELLVKANKIQLSMVITNIIDNAINFIPQNQKGYISITVEQKSNEAVIQVKDNGDGIDPEILPRLFTKFATKSFYGSGLGLYNCRKIIHMHQGGIWAQNNPQNEQGATVSFSIPLYSSSVHPSDPSPTTKKLL
jgi:signal transduction histidine kinase